MIKFVVLYSTLLDLLFTWLDSLTIKKNVSLRNAFGETSGIICRNCMSLKKVNDCCYATDNSYSFSLYTNFVEHAFFLSSSRIATALGEDEACFSPER